MIDIFFYLLLHTECSILVSKPSTSLLSASSGNSNPSVALHNSTTTFSSLFLDNFPFLLVNSSSFTLHEAIIRTASEVVRSLNGVIVFSAVSMYDGVGPASLVSCLSPSSVSLERSEVKDLSTAGTFVSSGYCREQRVVGCKFMNVTSRKGGGGWGVSEEGVLMDSVMERCEDGIYGLIVSGLSGQTLGGFACMNSSLIKNVRHSPTIKISLKKRLADECTYGSSTCNPSQRVSISTGPVTISDCTFSELSSSQVNGGALYIAGSSSSYINTVTISGCLFDSCYTSGSYSGGAMLAQNIEDVRLSTSNFSNCHTASESEQSTFGGAVVLVSISSSLSVSSCIFDTCHACTFCQ